MPAMLYQLTATAAQMCLPVPVAAAAPDGFWDWLDHWQTLIGATTGGLLGVAGAWIVAVSARRRERRVAAGMILPDMKQLDAVGKRVETALNKIGKIAGLDQDAVRASEAARQLEDGRPRLFALHTSAIGQLSDIDARLSSHLFQCQIIHHAFEEGMDARRAFHEAAMNMSFDATEPNAYRGSGSRSGTRTDSQLYREWRLAVEHATLANYFLDRLVFSRWPRWTHRVRMRFFPNDLDDRSAALLKGGTLPASTPAANATPVAAA